MSEDLLKVSEVAARFRVSKMTVYRLVHSGQIRSVKIGNSFRIPVSAVEDYIRRGG